MKDVTAPVMVRQRVETPVQHLHYSANDDRGIAVRPRQAFLDILRDQHMINVPHHLEISTALSSLQYSGHRATIWDWRGCDPECNG